MSDLPAVAQTLSATVGLMGMAALDWVTAWQPGGGLRGLLRDRAELCGFAIGLVLSVSFCRGTGR